MRVHARMIRKEALATRTKIGVLQNSRFQPRAETNCMQKNKYVFLFLYKKNDCYKNEGRGQKHIRPTNL